MIRNLIASIAIISCISCITGNDNSEDTNMTCDPGQVSGMYVIHSTEIDGNCGSINDTTTIIGGLSSSGDVDVDGQSDCVIDYSDFSNNQCTLNSDYTCYFSAEGFVVTYTRSLTQNSDGSSLKGTLGMTLRDFNGYYLCNSTYDVVWSRQE